MVAKRGRNLCTAQLRNEVAKSRRKRGYLLHWYLTVIKSVTTRRGRQRYLAHEEITWFTERWPRVALWMDKHTVVSTCESAQRKTRELVHWKTMVEPSLLATHGVYSGKHTVPLTCLRQRRKTSDQVQYNITVKWGMLVKRKIRYPHP